jgi:hypothetical protein
VERAGAGEAYRCSASCCGPAWSLKHLYRL